MIIRTSWLAGRGLGHAFRGRCVVRWVVPCSVLGGRGRWILVCLLDVWAGSSAFRRWLVGRCRVRAFRHRCVVR